MEAGDTAAYTWQAYLDRAFAGDVESLGELWDAYLRPVALLPYAYRLLENHDDACDLVESVLVGLLEESRYLKITRRDMDGFCAYARAMVYNLYVDLRREQRQIRFYVTRQTLEQLRTALPDTAPLIALLEATPLLRPVSQTTFCDWLHRVLGTRHSPQIETALLHYSRWEVARTETLEPVHFERQGGQPTQHDEVTALELLMIVEHEVLDSLTEHERLVLAARHAEDALTYRELADRTGIPRATLCDYYKSARAKILNHPKIRTFWDDR